MSELVHTVTHLTQDDTASKILVELLQNKNQTISHIADTLNITRQTVYRKLDSLLKKQLITKTDTTYQPLHPRRYEALLQSKKTELQSATQQFQNKVPELLEYYFTPYQKQAITEYKGMREYMMLMEEILIEQPEKIYIWGNMSAFISLVGEEYNSIWIQKRVKKQIHVEMLTYQIPFIEEFRDRDMQELRDVTYIPSKNTAESVLWLYSKTIVLWNPIIPKVIVIRDPIQFDFFFTMYQIMRTSIKK